MRRKKTGARQPRFVDIHNHFYPPDYINALRAGQSSVRVTEDRSGNPVIHYPGDYNVAVAGHRDIAFRQKVVERAGPLTQVLSFTTPGTHVEEPALARIFARKVNDAFASIIRERHAHFSALATLPLNDPAASADELERCITELRLPGAMLFSNVNGVALADSRYWPLYDRANRLGAVLMIHPTSPWASKR